MRRVNNILALLSLAGIFSVSAVAQTQGSNGIGGYAGAIDRMGFGARGMGMGNAMTAVTSGDLYSYYNPAIASIQTESQASIAYGVLSLDRKLNFISYGQPLRSNIGFSVALINAGVSNIDGRDEDNGTQTGMLSTSENTVLFNVGIHPSSKLAFGITTKFLYYSLYEDMNASGVGIDLGALYNVADHLTVGAVIQDIGAKYRWNSTNVYSSYGTSYSDEFPLRKRIAVSYDFTPWNTLADAEIEWIGSEPFARFGAEYAICNGVALRGGIDQINLSSSEEVKAKPSVGFSAETSFGKWRPAFQYAYVFEPYSTSGIHIISLSMDF